MGAMRGFPEYAATKLERDWNQLTRYQCGLLPGLARELACCLGDQAQGEPWRWLSIEKRNKSKVKARAFPCGRASNISRSNPQQVNESTF